MPSSQRLKTNIQVKSNIYMCGIIILYLNKIYSVINNSSKNLPDFDSCHIAFLLSANLCFLGRGGDHNSSTYILNFTNMQKRTLQK